MVVGCAPEESGWDGKVEESSLNIMNKSKHWVTGCVDHLPECWNYWKWMANLGTEERNYGGSVLGI